MNKKAFSLTEILVVILIVGVLSSIALPLYRRSLYKSRFSTLITSATVTANANEMHYLTHHTYTTDPEMLHVTVTGTSQAPNLQLVHDDHSSFVMVSRPDLPNNRYVLYQKYSENFPSEAHCEAATDDNDANWLCRDGLDGNLISGSVDRKSVV